MSDLITHLKPFNRKERYWLLHEALRDDTFRLGGEFREKLGKLLCMQIPGDAYVAMLNH